MNPLKKLIKTLFKTQPSDATNQQWRMEIQPLVDEHQAERRAWYKEKRDLNAEINRLRDQIENMYALDRVHPNVRFGGNKNHLPLDRIADLQRTPLPRIHSISPE